MGLCRSVKRDKRGHPVNRIPENLCFCISMYRSAAANAGIALFIPIRWPVRAMKWPCIFQRCMPSWDNGAASRQSARGERFLRRRHAKPGLIRINWRACWIVWDGRLKCCPERKSAWKPTRIPCIRRKKASGFLAAGVNRISLGVQSLHDGMLETLGRLHRANAARKAFRAIREAGCANLSLDLMWGLPGQTLEQWLEDARAAIALGPEHISAYGLTLEPGDASCGILRGCGAAFGRRAVRHVS